jgi:hypothetical protein
MMDIPAEENHVFDLVKTISSAYLKIRLHHLAKEHSLRINNGLIRKQFSKLILFHHQ